MTEVELGKRISWALIRNNNLKFVGIALNALVFGAFKIRIYRKL